MYLLENTEEAAYMRQNVIDLLKSNEASNMLLAQQLMQGGGVHDDFIQPFAESFVRQNLNIFMYNVIDYPVEVVKGCVIFLEVNIDINNTGKFMRLVCYKDFIYGTKGVKYYSKILKI